MREIKLDSSKMLMDCHADKSARNDRKRGFFKQDSGSCGGFVDFHHLQIFLSTKAKNTYKDFRIFDEKSGLSSDLARELPRVVMTADNRAESTIYRKTSEAVQAQRSRFL